MTTLVYLQDKVELEPGETVLEALERAGHRIPNSCRQGLCHACLMQTQDPVPAEAQLGLSDSQRQQGCFLACSCRPEGPLQVSLAGRELLRSARVVQKEMLNASILKLSLQADARWQPGQNVILWKDECTGRPYSIASHKHRDGDMVLHIRRHSRGEVSRWCHDQLQEGDMVSISPPEGRCVYDIHDSDKPLLMVATGSGLAPLYGILQEALAQGHAQPIDLYAAAGEPDGLYLRQELEQLAASHPQVRYYPAVRRGEDASALQGDVVDIVSQRLGSLRGTKVYLCGSPAMVQALHKRCFLAGAQRSDVITDPFVSAQQLSQQPG